MKNFIIQRNKHKQNDKQPDYRIVAKDGEEFVEVGAGWEKTDKNNQIYISCSLAKEYQDKKGYCLAVDTPSEAAQAPTANENTETRPDTQKYDEVPF